MLILMARPTRIEYKGAFHHVMNRGRSQQNIFHENVYFEAFLTTLKEASAQFNAIIHAYCLMTTHYHLLIETPKANLSRIMRHINGVYTQRHNGLRKTDGSLFRGRYKSVLVDEDAYLLQLSRYIHLNPVETKKPMVGDLVDYPWSSYPAYINQVKAPDWLRREKTYQMLAQKQRYAGYQKYVSQGTDKDIKYYYGKHNVLSVLGSHEFKKTVTEEYEETDLGQLRKALENKPQAEEIIKLICEHFKVTQKAICQNQAGKRQSNPVRTFAMFACRHYGDNSQKQIAEAFELSHPGSASFSINKVKKEISQGHWKKAIGWMEKQLGIVKSA